MSVRRRRLVMNRRHFIIAGLGASAAAFAKLEARPDTILHNGRILTISDREPEVEALAIAGDRIFAIGSSKDMLALAGGTAKRVDLGGKRVTPGFNDAHSHPCESGTALLTQVPLEVDSIDAVKTAIHAKATTSAPDEWIVG